MSPAGPRTVPGATRALAALLILLVVSFGCQTTKSSGSSGGSSSSGTLPVINSFTASAASITLGKSVTLSWSVTNATSLSLNQGVGPVTGSSVSVTPAATGTLTYVLTATNSTGSATASVTVTVTGATATAYYQSGGNVTLTNQTFGSSTNDESGVKVVSSGVLSLSDSTVTTSGNTSSADNSSFYGLDAGVLATSASAIHLANVTVKTTGTGANGVFATGKGTTVTLDNCAITCTGQLGHGVDATDSGVLTVANCTIVTGPGANSAAIATDRGGGTITVTGGTMSTSGADAPGVYSTGAITVSGATISASGSEAAVIEGANSIVLSDTKLAGSVKRGVMIYQSMSGDASGTNGVFTMTRGSLTAAAGPLFYVTNSTGNITLTGVTLTATSGTLIDASAGNWGTSGSNGGTVHFVADTETMAGNVTADALSTVNLTLRNASSLTGAVNTANTAKAANLTLDAASGWTVTADSYLATISDASGISGSSVTNITGNGHNVYYSASLAGNSYLGGKAYALAGGGYLLPK